MLINVGPFWPPPPLKVWLRPCVALVRCLVGHQHKLLYPIKTETKHGYSKPDCFKCLKFA